MSVDIEAEVEAAAEYWVSAQERAADDICLTVLAITASGQRIVIGFAGGMSDELRPVLGKVVRKAVSERIEAYVAAMTGWSSTRLDIQPHDDPERGEVLMVCGGTRQGRQASRSYTMLRFGDEIRLRPLNLQQVEVLTFQQILEEEGEL
jgi:hypothetical protein